LTRLSVHWLKLGIRLERIDPGKPQQNRRHERMHATLKAGTTRPPAATDTIGRSGTASGSLQGIKRVIEHLRNGALCCSPATFTVEFDSKSGCSLEVNEPNWIFLFVICNVTRGRKMKTTRVSICASAFIVLSSPALAVGPYVSGQAGISIFEDANNSLGGTTLVSSYDPGWALGGALGYSFPSGARLEGEIGYRRNDLDTISVNGASAGAQGDEGALSFMVNLWYDVDFGLPVTPYVGGGIGFARLSFDNVRVGGNQIVDDEDTVLAYQVGIGISYPIAPKLDMTVDYRYFATEDPSFTATNGASFNSEFHSHNIMVGLRFGF
jgi:opacity protein-like surface antigen